LGPPRAAREDKATWALAPDGKLLLAVRRPDGEVVDVWDAVTGKKVRTFNGYNSYIYALAFTPEAQSLVICFADRTFELWDVATGKKLRQFSLPEDQPNKVPLNIPGVGKPVFTAALSPDGNLLAFGSQDRYLVLKDVDTGQDIRRLDKLPDGVGPLAFAPDGKTLAWAGWQDPTVHLVEVLTGRERRTLHGHGGRVLPLAFSGDGKRLISASNDTTALIWDLTGKLAAGDQSSWVLSPKELETAWSDLAGDDAASAYQSMRRLAASPADAVSYLRERIKAIARPDEKQLARLIVDLDSDQFAVRDQSTWELEKLGEAASGACRKALTGDPSPELRRRLEKLLEKQFRQMWSPSREQLRNLRSLEVLELADTSDARQVLQKLAKGAPEARLTREAKAALLRLERH